MGSMRGLESLELLYRLCTDNLQELLLNVENYKIVSGHIVRLLSANWHNVEENNAVPYLVYDNFFTSLTRILDLTTKFNLELHKNNLSKNSGKKFLEALELHGKMVANLKNRTVSIPKTAEVASICEAGFESNSKVEYASILPAEQVDDSDSDDDTDSDDIRLHEGYRPIDLTQYKEGNSLNAVVSNISSGGKFYINDASSEVMKSIASLSTMFKLRQYANWPPPVNCVFGLLLNDDNIIARAIRRSSQKDCDSSQDFTKNSTYLAYLLDFGDVVKMSEQDFIYILPADVQQLPAQAIYCECSNEDALDVINQNIYKTISLRIVAQERKRLIVQPSDKIDCNPFRKSTDDKENTYEHETGTEKVETNPFRKATAANSQIQLSAADMEMLDDVPLGTSNAVKAVLGYVPQDDKRICRFFNPKTGTCFKGSNCRQEHTPYQPDGWTKDVLPASTIIDDRTPVIVYKKHSVLEITPTHILNLTQFYASIVDVCPFIWTAEDILAEKPLRYPLEQAPLLFDLVLAKYDDGLFYRGKIMEINDDGSNYFLVQYVDYGNMRSVHLRDMFACDYNTARMPFQAILFSLAGVRNLPDITREQYENGLQYLQKNILNQKLLAKVINQDEDIRVKFIEERFRGIPCSLIKLGCLKPFGDNGNTIDV